MKRCGNAEHKTGGEYWKVCLRNMLLSGDGKISWENVKKWEINLSS